MAGIVMIYEPGFSEYACVIEAPFSAVRFGKQPGQVEILDDLNRYRGDETKRREALEATMNMVIHLASMSKLMSQNFGSLAQLVEKKARVQLPEEPKEAPKAEAQEDKQVQNPEDVFRDALIYALLQDPNATPQTREQVSSRVGQMIRILRDRDEHGSVAAQLVALMAQSTDQKVGDREAPCSNCDTGNMVHEGTDPGGIMRFTCDNCGHNETYP